MRVRPSRRLPILLALLVGVWACGAGDGAEDYGSDPGRPLDTELAKDALRTYATIVHASYEDSAAGARELQDQIEAFVAEPTAMNQAAARQAWLDSREPYLQTEVYRFYDGPIDGPGGPEGLMNAWPLDEAFIDYVEGDPDAGIINDPGVTIDADSLLALNERGGEENVATGYHAVEFLLWGQDLAADGPGDRPHTDYVTDGTGTAQNQDRRALYLTTVAGLLVEHLEGLIAAWTPGVDRYRSDFEAAAPKEGLARVFTGMLFLTGFETGGERLQAALDSASQEDEHSCFSDNTHRDFIQDIQGISNVWHGSYTRTEGTSIEGTGLRDVVADLDPELADDMEDQIAHNLELARQIGVPFDRQVQLDNQGGREHLHELVLSMRDQERLIEEVFVTLGLEFPEVEEW